MMSFKQFIFFFSNVIVFGACMNSQKLTSKTSQNTFLYLTRLDSSADFYGRHIEIRQVLPKDGDSLIVLTIEDRDIIRRSKYSREQEIEILGEFLLFEGDTTRSNKQYRFRPSSMIQRPDKIDHFTIEIEALYSFTRILFDNYPSIQPVLFNKETGKAVGNDRVAISKIYQAYRTWYSKQKQEDFSTITLPLNGSNYYWQGDTASVKMLRKKI